MPEESCGLEIQKPPTNREHLLVKVNKVGAQTEAGIIRGLQKRRKRSCFLELFYSWLSNAPEFLIFEMRWVTFSLYFKVLKWTTMHSAFRTVIFLPSFFLSSSNQKVNIYWSFNIWGLLCSNGGVNMVLTLLVQEIGKQTANCCTHEEVEA